MGKTAKLFFSCFCYIVWLPLITCSPIVIKEKNILDESISRVTKQKIISIDSKINLDKRLSHGGPISSLDTKESLINIQMLDADTGWIITDRGTLFNTTNKGKTWKVVKVESALFGVVTSFSFVSKDIGWVSVVKSPSDILDDQGFQSLILITNDGGLHWHVQYSSKAIELKRVHFVSDREGWTIGSRLVRRESLENDYLVLHTTDGGEHWTDVSGYLNQDIGGGHVEDIYPEGSSKALILTSSRRIFSTIDGGENWQLIGEIQNEPPQTSMVKVGMSTNRLPWVLGATGGREGARTILAIKQADDTWLKYKIPSVIISDLLFLSNDRLVACGSIISNTTLAQVGDQGREGVVLYSSDAGASWDIAYITKQVKNLNTLSVVDSGTYWVLGQDGSLLLQKFKSM